MYPYCKYVALSGLPRYCISYNNPPVYTGQIHNAGFKKEVLFGKFKGLLMPITIWCLAF